MSIRGLGSGLSPARGGGYCQQPPKRLTAQWGFKMPPRLRKRGNCHICLDSNPLTHKWLSGMTEMSELNWTELKDWLAGWLTDGLTNCQHVHVFVVVDVTYQLTICRGYYWRRFKLKNEALATLSADYKRCTTHFKAGYHRVLNIRCYTILSCHFEWQLYWHKWHTLRLAVPLFYFVHFCRNKFG